MIRNYRPDDFDRLTAWAARVQEQGQNWQPLSTDDLLEMLTDRRRSPAEDLFVSEIEGEIAGYAAVKPELKIGRAVLGCFVERRRLRKTLLEDLVRRALDRSRGTGARAVHVNLFQGKARVRALFEAMGFARVRRFLEMGLALSGIDPPRFSRSSFRRRPLRRGEEGELADLQNRAFAQSWGYHPNTAEDIRSRLRSGRGAGSEVLAVFDKERLVAYCWVILHADSGRLYMMGVDPDYRGRGIGRQMLAAGLAALKARGARKAELTVDAGNRVALGLYRSLGFERKGSSLWYEKKLDPG